MTCVITGCALVDEAHKRNVWGDLFMIGEAWVFNAKVWPTGEAQWQEDTSRPDHTRALVMTDRADPFERRGVIVVAQRHAHLNPAANKYLGEGNQG